MNFQGYCGKIQKMRSERSLPKFQNKQVMSLGEASEVFFPIAKSFRNSLLNENEKKHYIDVIISLLAACYVKAVPFSFSLSLLLTHTLTHTHAHTRTHTRTHGSIQQKEIV